jgi:hypothetical protein
MIAGDGQIFNFILLVVKDIGQLIDFDILLIIFLMYGIVVFFYGDLTFDFIDGRLNE